MTILLVSPYPPVRDGIAGDGLRDLTALRAAGHQVEVLSPYPSAAHHHLHLRGPRGALALAKRVRRYERVIVEFHPDVFYPQPKTNRTWAAENLALLLAFRRARRVEVRVNEIDYRDGRDRGLLGRTSRALWHAVGEIAVHTDRERTDFIAAFRVDPARVVVLPQGTNFKPETSFDRAGARESLGIPADVTMFLGIGFIQPHKGFDRAIRAFAGLGPKGCRLDIVGSTRLEEPALQAYVGELETLAESTAGVRLHIDFVSDELFDRWIVASDVVVLPYRWIWSSGVLERAELYGRPVIASAVGGIPDQAARHTNVTLVADDVELARAMWLAAGDSASADAEPWPVGSAEPRAAVQAAVVARAAARRGGPPPARRPPGRSEPAVAGPSAVAPLRRLPVLRPAEPWSSRMAARLLKRGVRRVTAWELDPVVAQLNALQGATLAALERIARERSEAGPAEVAGPAEPPEP